MFDLWLRHKTHLMALLAILLLMLLTHITGIGCPIKFLTGISCPGCGMTRACVSALCFNFGAAFSYHPLWPLLPIVAVLLLFLGANKWRKAVYCVMGVIAALMLAVYVLRMIYGGGDIVVWRPEEGAICRIFKFFMKGFGG